MRWVCYYYFTVRTLRHRDLPAGNRWRMPGCAARAWGQRPGSHPLPEGFDLIWGHRDPPKVPQTRGWAGFVLCRDLDGGGGQGGMGRPRGWSCEAETVAPGPGRGTRKWEPGWAGAVPVGWGMPRGHQVSGTCHLQVTSEPLAPGLAPASCPWVPAPCHPHWAGTKPGCRDTPSEGW